MGEESVIKSVGNSTTTPRDLMNLEDVKPDYLCASESIAARLRAHGFKCTTVSISVRDKELFSYEKQCMLPGPTFLSSDIAEKAIELFTASYSWAKPIRSLGVRAPIS